MTNDIFKTHSTEALQETAAFGTWLQDAARKHFPVAVVARERAHKICLSTRDEAWEIDLKSVSAPLALAQFKQIAMQNQQLDLMMRNVGKDAPELVKMLAEVFRTDPMVVWRALLPQIVGDLTQAAHCINQNVTPHSKFKRIDQNAFEIALLLPQYEYGIAPYYSKVGLPLSKLVAEAAIVGNRGDPDWYVTYSNLWLRVLAFYSGDPTLGYAVAEDRDPIDAVANLFKCGPFEAEVLLLWQCCGRDMETFKNRFGDRVRDLPDIDELNKKIDRYMPALANSCAVMIRSYADTRLIETRYGRKLRPGVPMGEAVAFRVFGTVEELVAIAAVTFWNQRISSDILITRFEGGPAADVIRIAGFSPHTVEGQYTWLNELKALAPLANPLGSLPLKPTVFAP